MWDYLGVIGTSLFGAATISGGISILLGWFSKVTVERWIELKIAKDKAELELETTKSLEKLKAELAVEGAKTIEGLKATLALDAGKDIENLKAALAKVERLEKDLHEKRVAGYTQLWTLSGAINLFAKSDECDQVDLSRQLSDWYFKDGWALTEDAKTYYFLVQEVLSFAILHSITFKRPSDETLFEDEKSPVEVLDDIRWELFHVPKKRAKEDQERKTDEHQELEALRKAVVRWKKNPHAAQKYTDQEQAWVIFQLVMSRFRTHMTFEEGTRKAA